MSAADGINLREDFQMIRKAALLFIAAGLAIAGARTYTVSLFEKAMFGTTELTPGEYKVEVSDQKAIIRQGKLQSESPVKVEENASKFDATTVRYNHDGGKTRIEEIRLGGTKTKLVFTM
jgi:hypothetical protein